jgi:hypothetical protein
MELILLLCVIVYIMGFFVAKRNSDMDENLPKPAENYQELIQEMNEYRRSIGVKPIRIIRRK